LIRLFRVLRLLRSPALNIVLRGLGDGISSSPAIATILFLVFYIYSVTGITLFKKNDPHHFSSLHIAMLTMFQVSTMDNWNDIMYINVYGCNEFGYEEGGFLDIDDCTEPHAWGGVAVVFFVTFTICSSMVLLSLFLGVVSISMDHQKVEYQMKEIRREEAVHVAEERGLNRKKLLQFERAFSLVDVDGSNEIDEDEISFMLEAGNPDEEISETDVISKMQQLHLLDGKDEVALTFPEFIIFMLTVMEEKAASEKAQRKLELQKLQADHVDDASPAVASGGGKWGVVRRHLSSENKARTVNTILSTWKVADKEENDTKDHANALHELSEQVKAGRGGEEDVKERVRAALAELEKILNNEDERFDRGTHGRLGRAQSTDRRAKGGGAIEKARGAAGAAVGSLNVVNQHLRARGDNSRGTFDETTSSSRRMSTNDKSPTDMRSTVGVFPLTGSTASFGKSKTHSASRSPGFLGLFKRQHISNADEEKANRTRSQTSGDVPASASSGAGNVKQAHSQSSADELDRAAEFNDKEGSDEDESGEEDGEGGEVVSTLHQPPDNPGFVL
jgi:hypothetical protein